MKLYMLIVAILIAGCSASSTSPAPTNASDAGVSPDASPGCGTPPPAPDAGYLPYSTESDDCKTAWDTMHFRTADRNDCPGWPVGVATYQVTSRVLISPDHFDPKLRTACAADYAEHIFEDVQNGTKVILRDLELHPAMPCSGAYTVYGDCRTFWTDGVNEAQDFRFPTKVADVADSTYYRVDAQTGCIAGLILTYARVSP